jgi:kynurenine formamidase
VDLRDLLDAAQAHSTSRTITIQLLNDFESAHGFDFSKCYRLLFCTRRYPATFTSNPDDQWDDNFAYFDPQSAHELARKCRGLLCIGIDSPSVDAPSVSPICEGSHGVFYRSSIAHLENLQFRQMEDFLDGKKIVEGSMLTVFNPMQSFDDSRGCSVVFFPRTPSGT